MEAPLKPLHPFVAVVVRTLRRGKGWSQEKLAREVGVEPSEISKLESGRREPTIWTLQRVGRVLDVSCPQLLWQAEMLQRRVERDEESG